MAKYQVIDNKTGKKYIMEGDHPPSDEEVRANLDKYTVSKAETPPPDENSPLQNVLEGAGLDPLAHPSTIPGVIKGMGTFAANPIKGTYEMGKGMYGEGKDRFNRYFDAMANNPNIGTAAQTMMAPIPFVGNAMENADKGIFGTGPGMEQDPAAQERLLGNILGVGLMAKGPAIAKSAGPMVESGVNAVRSGLGKAAPIMADAGMAGLDAVTFNAPTRAAKSFIKRRTARVAEPVKPPPIPLSPLEVKKAQLEELRINRQLAQEQGGLPQGDSVLNQGDVDELKRLRLEQQLAKAREGVSLEEDPLAADKAEVQRLRVANQLAKEKAKAAKITPKTKVVDPTVNSSSRLDPIAEFPTRYKNVKLKDTGTPQGGATKSSITPKDPVPQEAPPTPDLPASKPTLKGDLDPEILKQYVSEEEAKQIIENQEIKKWLPETHEEWKEVNALEEAGMDRVEAMKKVRNEALTKAAAEGKPLNSRESGTNPRALGTSLRNRGVSPRALDNKRREP